MRLRSVLRLAGIIAGCILCGAILVYTATSLSRGVYMTIASSSWAPVEAKVFTIDSHALSGQLRYRYVVGGVHYYRTTFAFLSAGTIPDKRLIEKSYRVGDNIKVFVDPNDPGRSVVLRRSLHYVWVDVVVILLTCFVGWHILRRQTASLLEDEKPKLSKRTLAWIGIAVSGVVACLLALSDIPHAVRLVMALYVILVACSCFAALGVAKCAELMQNMQVRMWAVVFVLLNVVFSAPSLILIMIALTTRASDSLKIVVGLVVLGWFWGLASALRQIVSPASRRFPVLTSLGLLLGLVTSFPLISAGISVPSIWGPYELDMAARLRYWFPLPSTVFWLFLIFSSFGAPRSRAESSANADGPSDGLDEFRRKLPPGSGAA